MRAKLVRSFASCTVAVVSAQAIRGQDHHPMHEQSTPHTPRASAIELHESVVSLPMRDFGGRPVVPVTINGKGPYPFILDTGADVSVVDEKLNAELKLPSGAGMSTGGERFGLTVVTIEQLGMGGVTLRELHAVVMPLADLLRGVDAPRGVLSASSFPGYLLTYDFPARQILLTAGALDEPDDETTFAYAASDALPTVPLHIADRETRVDLDTGAATALALPRSFLQELPLASQPRAAGTAHTPTSSAPISKARVKGAITLGQFALDVGEVEFSDLRAGHGPPRGQLGCGALRAFVVTLDAANRRIRFARSD